MLCAEAVPRLHISLPSPPIHPRCSGTVCRGVSDGVRATFFSFFYDVLSEPVRPVRCRPCLLPPPPPPLPSGLMSISYSCADLDMPRDRCRQCDELWYPWFHYLALVLLGALQSVRTCLYYRAIRKGA